MPMGYLPMNNFHVPVLTREVIDGLQVVPEMLYIDATAGGGGHSTELLKRGARVLALDRDEDAIGQLRERFKDEDKITILCGNFRNLDAIAKIAGFSSVEGVLFDLGVSSYQLDTPKRGFSYRFLDSPLDMRMSQDEVESAESIINERNSEELYEIFSRYGEEELAYAISHAIIRARPLKRISTVGDVVSIVESMVENKKNRGSVLRRVFQALRIAVNDEICALEEGLTAAEILLKPGGRLAVISFHSLEDRKVKLFMTRANWRMIAKKPMTPSDEERTKNSRSQSAKLRIAVKV